MNRTLYLAGRINGLTYEEATKWRIDIKKSLKNYNFNILSPMRGKEFLNVGDEKITDKEFTDEYKKMIFLRDKTDIENCDDFVVNFMNEKPSFGTNWEMGYAYSLNKNIYVLNAPEYLKRHPFFISSICYNFNYLKEFIKFYTNEFTEIP